MKVGIRDGMLGLPFEETFRKAKEIGFDDSGRQRSKHAARRLERRVGKIDRQHVVPALGKGSDFVTRSAAGNEHSQGERTGIEPARKPGRYAPRVPGRNAAAEPHVPEIRLRAVLRHDDRGRTANKSAARPALCQKQRDQARQEQRRQHRK